MSHRLAIVKYLALGPEGVSTLRKGGTIMSWIAWIVVGLIAGALAKLVMPGTEKEPTSFLGTMLLGIAGACVGGWIWNILFQRPGATGINIGSVFIALLGSVIVIGALRLFARMRAQ
jgi:uncharacterized membrane protein YeaQ/YmgE (transglycosylase-associated protein family)